eukprot:61186_1
MLAISSIALLLSQFAPANAATWDYADPAAWKEQYEFCALNDESPINIQSPTEVDATLCDGQFDWDINNGHREWRVINNGHTLILKPVEVLEVEGIDENDIETRRRTLEIQQVAEESLKDLDLNSETIARFPNYFAAEGSTTKHYCLDSIHFHWGDDNAYGSEHKLEGKFYPMEAHFVHFDCNHADLGSAIEKYQTVEAVEAARKNGEDVYVLGVVTVFYEIQDPFLMTTNGEPKWKYNESSFDQFARKELFDKIKYPHKSGDDAIVIDFSLGVDFYSFSGIQHLIPYLANANGWLESEEKGYYTYEGSMTTPPCMDVVRWYVLNAFGKISTKQLELFRSLQNEEGGSMSHNDREIQSNANQVYFCKADYSGDQTDVLPEEVAQALATLAITGIVIGSVCGVLCLCGCIGG